MDSRIKYSSTENRGVISARKNGVNCEIAQRSQYISFLDADDELYTNILQTLYLGIKQYNADISIGNIRRMIKHNLMWKHCDFTYMKSKTPRYYSHSKVINVLLIGFLVL